MPTYDFPLGGIFKGNRSGKQPAKTARDMKNVRPYFDGRSAGGQRQALDKWGGGTQIGSSEQPVVAMCVVAAVL